MLLLGVCTHSFVGSRSFREPFPPRGLRVSWTTLIVLFCLPPVFLPAAAFLRSFFKFRLTWRANCLLWFTKVILPMVPIDFNELYKNQLEPLVSFLVDDSHLG